MLCNKRYVDFINLSLRTRFGIPAFEHTFYRITIPYTNSKIISVALRSYKNIFSEKPFSDIRIYLRKAKKSFFVFRTNIFSSKNHFATFVYIYEPQKIIFRCSYKYIFLKKLFFNFRIHLSEQKNLFLTFVRFYEKIKTVFS